MVQSIGSLHSMVAMARHEPKEPTTLPKIIARFLQAFIIYENPCLTIVYTCIDARAMPLHVYI